MTVKLNSLMTVPTVLVALQTYRPEDAGVTWCRVRISLFPPVEYSTPDLHQRNEAALALFSPCFYALKATDLVKTILTVKGRIMKLFCLRSDLVAKLRRLLWMHSQYTDRHSCSNRPIHMHNTLPNVQVNI